MGDRGRRKERGPLVVLPSVASDVERMAPRLRNEDRAEIVAASGEPSIIALGRGFVESMPCFTAYYNDRPAVMFGVTPSKRLHPLVDPDFPRVGYVWLLATDDVNEFKTAFLRLSRKWFDRVTRDYDIVGNVVDERNTRHIQWLEWVGVKFLRTHKHFGHLGLPFREFVKVINESPPQSV